MAPRTLTLLLEKLSGRPSFSPTPTNGASLLGSPHPSSNQYFPRAVIASQPPLETVDNPSDYGFSRQYLWLQFLDHRHQSFVKLCNQSSIFTRASSSPELCDQSSTFTRALSSPELRDQSSTFTRDPHFTKASSSPELHDQRSTIFRDPSSTELCRHLHFGTRASLARRSVVTCRHLRFAGSAPPFSEVHCSSELHPRLPRLLHPMSFPFKPLPTTRKPFFLATTPTPASWSPSTLTLWELFHRLLQLCTDEPAASNRYQRRGALFLTSITNSGVIASSAPSIWDIFRRLLQPPHL